MYFFIMNSIGTETQCTIDCDKMLADLGDATIAITAAVFDCANTSTTAKAVACTDDILAATAAFTYMGIDIANMAADC